MSKRLHRAKVMDAGGDAWRRLANAVILQACRDSLSANGTAWSARRWLLFSKWSRYLLDVTDHDYRKVVEWVLALPGVDQPGLPGM